MPRGIPGFDESVAQEQRERNESYLDISSIIGDIPIRQMTPMDMVRLTYGRNPYLTGSGAITHPAAAQFIFQLAVTPVNSISSALESVAKFTIEELDDDISAYMDLTFRDQNGSASDSDAPIACSVAWLEYRMSCKPFEWDRERTLSSPLRLIWQQIRCWQAEQGEVVKNRLSGANTDQFLCEVQRRINEGTLTQADLDKMNEPWLKSRTNSRN